MAELQGKYDLDPMDMEQFIRDTILGFSPWAAVLEWGMLFDLPHLKPGKQQDRSMQMTLNEECIDCSYTIGDKAWIINEGLDCKARDKYFLIKKYIQMIQ